MPIGDARRRGVTGRRGFTYVGLLIVVALLGAALASAGVSWRHRLQREREIESIARAQELADALGSWQAVAGTSRQALPDWNDLLEDRRVAPLLRHLRRAWTDPLTGETDWQWVRDEAGQVVGVRSRSMRPAIVRVDADGLAAPSIVCVCDRVFRPRSAAVASAAASAAALP